MNFKLILLTILLVFSACGRNKTDQMLYIFERHSALPVDMARLKSVLVSNQEEGLKKIDRYAGITSLGEAQTVASLSSGERKGFGLNARLNGDEFCIESVPEGSPAFDAGIRPGDCILSINNKTVKGLDPAGIFRLISDSGDVMETGLIRITAGKENVFKAKLWKRLFSVPGFFVLNDKNIAYLRITQLYPGIGLEISRKGGYLNGKKLIIDLRDTFGGSPKEIASVLGLFTGQGRVMFRTMSRHQGYTAEYYAGDNAVFPGMNIAVLVNGMTASGAEIIAASLRENAGAKIIGTETFGMGGVQKTFRVDKKTGLRLTVCFMAPPSGENIESRGLRPDKRIDARFGGDVWGRLPNDASYKEAVRLLK